MKSKCFGSRFSLRVGLLLTWILLLGGVFPVQARPVTPPTSATAMEPALAGDAIDLPTHGPAGWWATVQETIRRSEYDITWQEGMYLSGTAAPSTEPGAGVYQAPNRAHNLRTYFAPAGIRVIPRAGDVSAWEWGLALAGYGYIGSVQPVGKAELVISANRAEYRRGDPSTCPRAEGSGQGITEWYVNDERGLEQGFTLHAPPESDGGDAGRWIAVRMDLGGDLNAALNDAASAIEFTTAGGVGVVRYDHLYAVDATGRELPARFAIDGQAIDILVDASQAVYPIAIDPLATSPNWSAESDRASAEFGFSVGTAGDVNGDGYSDVIVGAPKYDGGQAEQGRAFVYHGSATGLSTAPDWTIVNNYSGMQLGYAVATAGDVNGDGYADVIVGAPYCDFLADVDNGRTFVYHGSATGLDLNGSRPTGDTTNADWSRHGNQEYAHFGSSVAAAGDVNGDGYADVIIGMPEYDRPGTPFPKLDAGMAIAYHGSAEGLASTVGWWIAGAVAGDKFGSSVATAGDVNGDGYADVIVGAPYYDGDQADEGRAYVYRGSGGGLSTTASWTAESNQADAHFGVSVSTAGDVNGDGYGDVIVGADDYRNLPFLNDEGKAFVYHGSAYGLLTAADWTATTRLSFAHFGVSVGTAGDVNGDGYSDVIVGADGGWGSELQGRAYVYYGSPSGLGDTAGWTVEGEQDNSHFGIAVGTAGDVNGDGYSDAIVGANGYDGGQTDEGRAYVYHGSAGGLSTVAGWSANGPSGSYFGLSLGTAGDVNGDGYADVIVGAEAYDNGQGSEGAAFVYHGAAAGLDTSIDWTAAGDLAGARFGTSVATAGDVNGDGYDDVIVGAPEYIANPETEWGAAFVYYGSTTGLSTAPDWSVVSHVYRGPFGGHFGTSVASAGDVNGDGYADVIVGAPNVYDGWGYHGWAHVYHGSAEGLGDAADWSAQQYTVDENWFGYSAGTAGDVNGDGYSDVIVGAFKYKDSEEEEGAAFVYYGSAAGLSASPDWTAQADVAHDWFGYAVGTAGDVNGDGYADAIVLNRAADRALVYHGSATGLSDSAGWASERNPLGPWSKEAVGTAGDVNGDGYADVIVGASGYDNGQTNEGAAFVYHGSADGLSASPDWHVESDQGSAELGCAVGTAGDVNGDGYADVLVGSPYRRARAYYGNGGRGLALAPRQRRSDASAPIAHLGMSDSRDSFRLALTGRTPFGRGKVKLEWEVKPLGTLYDGTGTQESTVWVDVGVAGAALDERVSGLAASTAYHWRVRLRYHPATTPFQQHSRWLTMPWNGWQEQDLRTALPAVAFDAATYRVNEGKGSATITVALDEPSPLVVTVDYATSDGTAGSPDDYVLTSGTLTFEHGDTSETFEVPVVDDALEEGDETVILTLSGAGNALIGGTNPVTLTIVDDDGESFVYLPIVVRTSP